MDWYGIACAGNNYSEDNMNIIFSSDGDPKQDLDNFSSYLVQIFLDALGKYAKCPTSIVTLDKGATREEINRLGDFLQRHVKVEIEDSFDRGILKTQKTGIERN